MSGWQRNHKIAEILSAAEGGLSVHVARWPGVPVEAGGPKPPAVMWVYMDYYRYLPPDLARRFAAALIQAADQIEQDTAPTEAH